MRKNIVVMIAMMAIATGGYISYRTATSDQQIQLSCLNLENIEALSIGEITIFDHGCIGTGDGCGINGYWLEYSGYVEN